MLLLIDAMKEAIIFAILGLSFAAAGCVSNRTAACADNTLFQAEAKMKVTLQRFVELKDAGCLPGFTGDEHGELDVIYIDDKLRKQEWFLPFGDAINGCRECCLVRVRLKENGDEYQRAYLFCCDGEVPKLLAAYILAHGQLRRLPGGTAK